MTNTALRLVTNGLVSDVRLHSTFLIRRFTVNFNGVSGFWIASVTMSSWYTLIRSLIILYDGMCKLLLPSLPFVYFDFLFVLSFLFSDVGGSLPLFHLHGKTSWRSFVSTLLQTLLLCLYSSMADRTEISVPSLPSYSSPSWASQLPMGGGSYSTAWYFTSCRVYHDTCCWQWERQVK